MGRAHGGVEALARVPRAIARAAQQSPVAVLPRFADFAVSGAQVQDLSSNELANAPHRMLALGATWKNEAGWFANINANYRSATYQLVTVQTARELKARTLVNAKVGRQNATFGAYLTANNIFDTHYIDYTSLNVNRQQALMGELRIVGVLLEARD